jgi:hypothetical protein
LLDHRSVGGPATHHLDAATPAPEARSALMAMPQAPVGAMSMVDALHLQRLAGNRAVVEKIERRRSTNGRAAAAGVQRLPWDLPLAAFTTPAPAPASTAAVPSAPPPATTATTATPTPATAPWKTTDEATNALVKAFADGDKGVQETAKGYIYARLDGMKPDALIADLATVQRLDVLYHLLPKRTNVDIPRLATAMAGVMSKKSADTLLALEMLDQLRSSKGSEAFWTEHVAPYTKDQLQKIFLVADRKVIEALRDALETAPPQVHKKVGPLLASIFDPPAGDIVLEFVPDQIDVAFRPKLPDGTRAKRLAPIGVLTAKVRGRVATSVAAQGGEWQSQDAGGGHHADPTKPGVHKLGSRQKVRTSFWMPSQLAQGTPLREVTKAGKTAVEYKGEDGRWHDTMSLALPMSREYILERVKELRDQLDPTNDAKALALVPEGVIPTTWLFNDFGDHAYRILGTDQLVHTSPNQELQYKVGIQEDLGWSHGCLHLKPSGRDQLERMHLLKGGVTLKVHAYVKGVKEYGEAPKFE